MERVKDMLSNIQKLFSNLYREYHSIIWIFVIMYGIKILVEGVVFMTGFQTGIFLAFWTVGLLALAHWNGRIQWLDSHYRP